MAHTRGGFPDGSRAPNKPENAFAEAFGIKAYGSKKTGRGTIWSKYGDNRWFFVGRQIFEIVERQLPRERPIKETAAVFEAAQMHNIEFKTAWRDWQRFKEAYPREVSFIAERLGARPRTSDKK